MKPYYEDAASGITIYHGDCLEVIPLLGVEVDLVFTSPPYNLGVSTGGGFVGEEAPVGHYSELAGLGARGNKAGKWSGGSLANGYGIYADAMPPAEYEAWQREFLRFAWQALTPSGAIFYNHKPRIQAGALRTPLDWNPGLPVRQIVIWARAGGVNFTPSAYCPTHEWVVLFAKPGFRLRDRSASGVGDVWRISQETNSDHPAPFPLLLPKRAIETTGAGLILDPFMGSGTTLRAAKDFGRRAIGIEIEERYCEIAANRLAQSVMFTEVSA